MTPLVVFLICSFGGYVEGLKVGTSFIKIMGQNSLQSLPAPLTKSWNVWTFEDNQLSRIEGAGNPTAFADGELETEEEGWVDPTSYDDLYFPSDLPLPLGRPALGVVLTNGTPRYIMPSILLSLETPGRLWRNRGICTLPRSNRWIDLYGDFAPSLKSLKLYSFGQMAPDVRFLEDQDGAASWENIVSIQGTSTSGSTMLQPAIENFGIDIWNEYEALTKYLSALTQTNSNFVSEGYHFIDIPLATKFRSRIKIPQKRIKMFLTDLLYPSDLIGLEPDELDSEPCGILDVKISPIGPGSTSKFLPKAYVDLYEPGNVI